MPKNIPAPLISVLADNLPHHETHEGIDSLFSLAGAPGDPPEGSKAIKTKAWLRRINNESSSPLKILGKLIESYIELPELEEYKGRKIFGTHITSPEGEFKTKIESALAQANLTYVSGGLVTDGHSTTSLALRKLIENRDLPAIEAEFDRALSNVESEPREAVSAACNILESIFKAYITDERLAPPQKQDLQNVWKVVRSDLGFDPSKIQDDDLKKILSGMFSVVDGIGAFRTHASSAHGEGKKRYRLKPRHARLAINSSHTLALFILETWDEKRSSQT